MSSSYAPLWTCFSLQSWATKERSAEPMPPTVLVSYSDSSALQPSLNVVATMVFVPPASFRSRRHEEGASNSADESAAVKNELKDVSLIVLPATQHVATAPTTPPACTTHDTPTVSVLHVTLPPPSSHWTVPLPSPSSQWTVPSRSASKVEDESMCAAEGPFW